MPSIGHTGGLLPLLQQRLRAGLGRRAIWCGSLARPRPAPRMTAGSVSGWDSSGLLQHFPDAGSQSQRATTVRSKTGLP
jgi:hypothetical protein